MRILDGPFGICDVVIENVQNGPDNGRIKKIVEEINRTTPEDVMKAASLYLRKEDITTRDRGRDIEVGLAGFPYKWPRIYIVYAGAKTGRFR